MKEKPDVCMDADCVPSPPNCFYCGKEEERDIFKIRAKNKEQELAEYLRKNFSIPTMVSEPMEYWEKRARKVIDKILGEK